MPSSQTPPEAHSLPIAKHCNHHPPAKPTRWCDVGPTSSARISGAPVSWWLFVETSHGTVMGVSNQQSIPTRGFSRLWGTRRGDRHENTQECTLIQFHLAIEKMAVYQSFTVDFPVKKWWCWQISRLKNGDVDSYVSLPVGPSVHQHCAPWSRSRRVGSCRSDSQTFAVAHRWINWI